MGKISSEARIQGISVDLDLGFGDYFKREGENVRGNTLRGKLDLTKKAVNTILLAEA
jgi:hypothetical protein